MTTPTTEINRWIIQHGSERDALNVAVAKLTEARMQLQRVRRKLTLMQDIVPFTDCLECDGVIADGQICINCWHDPTVETEEVG